MPYLVSNLLISALKAIYMTCTKEFFEGGGKVPLADTISSKKKKKR